MTNLDDARDEAARRWPHDSVTAPLGPDRRRDRRIGFEPGARWQADREPKVEIVREEGKPARCKVWRDGVLLFDGRDYSADLADREPSEDYPDAEGLAMLRGDREPSDAEVESGCVAFYEGAQGITSWERLTTAEPALADRYRDGIRAALLAAQEVRQA